MEFVDIYTREGREEELEDDVICAFEEGFMEGYEQAADY